MNTLFVVVVGIETATVPAEDTAIVAASHIVIVLVGDTAIAHTEDTVIVTVAMSHWVEDSLGTLVATWTEVSCLLSEPALQMMRRSVACWSGSRQFFKSSASYPCSTNTIDD